MKRHALSFLCGALAVVAYAVHLGPDALATTAAKWQAAQRTYIVYAEPMRELDESMVPTALAYEAPVKPTKGAKKR